MKIRLRTSVWWVIITIVTGIFLAMGGTIWMEISTLLTR